MASDTESIVSNHNHKSENLRSVLCSTCLSINRVLHPVAALRDLVPLLNDVGLDINDSICWECRAIMHKFDKFKKQARRSISSLHSLVGNNIIHGDEIYNQVCSLSTLKQSTKNIFDAQFSFHIKKENIEFAVNDQSDKFSLQKNTCVDIEPCHVKEEVFLIPTLQQETVPVEYSKKQFLITLVPITAAGSKLTLPGSSQGIPPQIPSTSIKDSLSESGSESGDEDNEDAGEEAKIGNKLDKGKKQSRYFSNTDFFTKILTEDEMLKCREKEREQMWFKNAKLRCMSCIQYFGSKKALKSHDLLHCPIQQGHACSICDLRFMSQEAAMKHQKTHYINYYCSYCSYSSYSQQRLMAHWQSRHDTSAKRECIDCGVEFRNQRRLRYHRKRDHSEKPCRVECVECGKSLASSCSLNTHMRTHKGTIPEVECDICHKKCRGSSGLRAHMRTHNETQPENAYCAECDKQFNSVYLYRNHLKYNSKHAHPDTFKFQCSYCGNKFYCKTQLRNHIQAMHLKLNDKECEHCNQKFHNKVQLQKHQREKHSGKVKTRNNICHLCDKAFTRKKSLSEHMNTHLGKRPFKCVQCDATFAYSAALYTHTRLLHLKLKRGTKHSDATVEHREVEDS